MPMTAKLIAGAAIIDPRLGAHALLLASMGSALIVIASGVNNLSFGLVALGCESLAATVYDATLHFKRAPMELPDDSPRLLSA
jgi:hypothetical protein